MMAVTESFRPDDRQNVRQVDRSQLLAVLESTGPDIAHALWNRDVGEVGQATESLIVDECCRVRDGEFLNVFVVRSHDDLVCLWQHNVIRIFLRVQILELPVPCTGFLQVIYHALVESHGLSQIA